MNELSIHKENKTPEIVLIFRYVVVEKKEGDRRINKKDDSKTNNQGRKRRLLKTYFDLGHAVPEESTGTLDMGNVVSIAQPTLTDLRKK